MAKFSRLSVLLAAVLFCVPTLARADGECSSAQGLRGAVKTVLVSKGKVVAAAGSVRTTLHRSERIDISRDRRTVTIVGYSSDPSPWRLLNLWPTSVCEFDDAGRVVRTQWKRNGLTAYIRAEMTYDAQGRLARRKSWAHNPELTYDRNYDHSANTVTDRLSGYTRIMNEYDKVETRPAICALIWREALAQTVTYSLLVPCHDGPPSPELPLLVVAPLGRGPLVDVEQHLALYKGPTW